MAFKNTMLDVYKVTALTADLSLNRAFARDLRQQLRVMNWRSLVGRHIYHRFSGRLRHSVGAARGGSAFLRSSEGPSRVVQGSSGNPGHLENS